MIINQNSVLLNLNNKPIDYLLLSTIIAKLCINMKSMFLLNIKDAELNKKFSISRNKEILKSLLVLLGIRLINVTIVIINVHLKNTETDLKFWILRVFGLLW